MFDVTSSEFVVIALVAFLVFGPRRLPQLFRKAGQWWTAVQRAGAELRNSIETEAGRVTEPLNEIGEEISGAAEAVRGGLTGAADAFRDEVRRAAAEPESADGHVEDDNEDEDEDGRAGQGAA